MRLPRKIVLHTPDGVVPGLESVIAQFFVDQVVFVAVVGHDCSRIEDIIDEMAVERGSPDTNFILTSSHENETLAEAVAFANSLTGEYEGSAEIVEVSRSAQPRTELRGSGR